MIDLIANWGMYVLIVVILLISLASFLGINDSNDILEGSLTEAIHRELLKAIPGLCLDEFASDDSTNDILGDRVTVHGTTLEKQFCVRVWHETINGRVRILDVEARDKNKLSALIQCEFSATKPFRK